jgi:hypothetical protein
MCAWDAKKNKVIAEKKLVEEGARNIYIQSASYNGGPTKIGAIQRDLDKEWVSHVKPREPELAKKFGIAIKKMAIMVLEDEVK